MRHKRSRLGRDEDRITLPFASHPRSEVPIDPDVMIACGYVVTSGTIEVEGVGTLPTLMMRFAKPDGSGFYPPIVLVLDEADMAELPALVKSSCASAIRTAQRSR